MCTLNKSNKSIILRSQPGSEYPFVMSLGIVEPGVVRGGGRPSAFPDAGGGGGILEGLTAA